MEMLQFEGWRLAKKLKQIQRQLWMGEAFYVQTQPHHKVLNDDSRETSRSMRENAVHFPKICRKTEKSSLNSCWDA
jgi:hypothetical protein